MLSRSWRTPSPTMADLCSGHRVLIGDAHEHQAVVNVRDSKHTRVLPPYLQQKSWGEAWKAVWTVGTQRSRSSGPLVSMMKPRS